jgi:hypothetical protein
MNRKPITLGVPLENDTYYYADRDRYDIFTDDTFPCSDKRCFYENCESGFISVAFLLTEKHNITLDFGGATLMLHGRIQPFMIDRCENIAIKNCVVQYSGAFYMEAVIDEVGCDFLHLIPRDGFTWRIHNGRLIPYGECWESDTLDRNTMFMQVFDPVTRDGAGSFMLGLTGDVVYPEENPPAPIYHLTVTTADQGFILHGHTQSDWKPGMILAFSHEPRDKSSVSLIRCENCSIENYRIINGAGMGIFIMHSHNTLIDGFQMRHDEKSVGIIANNADGIHAVACTGYLRIQNSICEGMIDDALNVHNNFYLTEKCDGCQLVAKKVSKCLLPDNENFCAGDEIEFHFGNTMETRASRRIEFIERRSDGTILITLDKPADAQAGDLIENMSTQPEVVVYRSVFGKSNSHLRFQSRSKITVEDCIIGLPILLTGDVNYWYECSPVCDFNIINCNFVTDKARINIIPEFNPTEKEPYYHKNISIADCNFTTDSPVCGNRAAYVSVIGCKNTLGHIMHLPLTDCGVIETDCIQLAGYKNMYTSLLRVPTNYDFDISNFNELFKMLAESHNCDQIVFFTQPFHSIHSREEIFKRLNLIKSLIERSKTLGYKAGIDVLCTIGFMDEYVDGAMSDYDLYDSGGGNFCAGRLCPLSPKTTDYIRAIYTKAAECKPDMIYIDDDIDYSECRCPRCETEFNSRYGDENRPAETIANFNRDRIEHCVKIACDAVRAVDKTIALGYMSCSDRIHGNDSAPIAMQLRNISGSIMWRPGGGVYNDDSFAALFTKVGSVARQLAALPDFVNVRQSEIENFPDMALNKSPAFVGYEAVLYLAVGCNGTSINFLPSSAFCMDEYRRYWDTFPRLKLFSETLDAVFTSRHPIGIAHYVNNKLNASGGLFSESIYRIGLPEAYRSADACCYILNGSLAKQLDYTEAKAMLTKGVMLDCSALDILNGLGLGEYTGFVSEKCARDVITRSIPHLLNGEKFFYRDVHPKFGWSGEPCCVKKTSKDAEYISEIRDYGLNPLGYAEGIFENELGGRVYVSGYSPFAMIESLNTTTQYKSVFRWLSNEALPAYIDSYHRVSLWIRHTADGIGAIVANSTTEPQINVRIALRIEKNSVSLFRNQSGILQRSILLMVKRDGVYTLFVIPQLDVYEAVIVC